MTYYVLFYDIAWSIAIELAAAHGQHELVEVLFPRTKPIPSLPDWSVDGIIRWVKSMPSVEV